MTTDVPFCLCRGPIKHPSLTLYVCVLVSVLLAPANGPPLNHSSSDDSDDGHATAHVKKKKKWCYHDDTKYQYTILHSNIFSLA